MSKERNIWSPASRKRKTICRKIVKRMNEINEFIKELSRLGSNADLKLLAEGMHVLTNHAEWEEISTRKKYNPQCPVSLKGRIHDNIFMDAISNY